MEVDIEKLKEDKELLKELKQKKEKALKSGDIVALYELLDTFLLLQMDEDMDEVYEKILEVAFEELTQRLVGGKGFDLSKDFDLNVARAIYEHAIERWDRRDYQGAKELFLLLSYMIEDEKIGEGLLLALALTAEREPLQRFLDEFVDKERIGEESLFFDAFTPEAKAYLQNRSVLIEKELEKAQKW